tara:strand:+ start:2685 stop:3827 length:1143 start_codon:yes stop_codon:yes gene_type:complete
MKNLYFIFLLLLVFSCSTENNTNDISQLSDDNTVAKVQDIENLVSSTSIEYDDDWQYYNTNVKTRLSNVSTLNTIFSKHANDIDVLMAVAYVTKDKVDGIGINYFNSIDGNYYLDIYSSQKSSQNLIKEHSFISNDVLMLDLMRLKYYLFPKSDIEMIIANDFQYKDSNTNRSDLSLYLRNKTWDKLSLINSNNSLRKSDPELIQSEAFACGYIGPCRTQNGSACKPGIFHCTSGGCGANELTHAFSEKMNLNPAEIDLIVKFDKYYKFRNDFLSQSALGIKYAEIFYASTGHFKDIFDLDLLIDLHKVFPDINDSIDKLLDVNFNGIIISESLRSDIINIVDKMISKTNSTVFKDILTEFKLEFNMVSNKTRSQINSII